MNELQIFENEEFGKVRTIKPNCLGEGFVYAVEYGEYVKIGSTINPYNRLMSFLREKENYNNGMIGNIAITPSHSNFRDNERILHYHYAAKRKKGTELFSISLSDCLEDIPNILMYEHNVDHIEKSFESLKKLFMELWTPSWRDDFYNIIQAYPYIFNNKDQSSVENELRDISDMNEDFENLIFEFGISSLSPIIMNCIRYKNDEYEGN